jgi:hypothetical protein
VDRSTDLPDGLFGDLAVQPSLQKYFRSRLTQIKTISIAVSSHRGAYRDRHGRGARCDGRGSVADERRRRGRRSRVVLAPRRWRQVCGGNSADDGDNKARSPGRARRKSLKPLRAGMPGDAGGPVVATLVCHQLFAHEAAGAAGTRHSPRPLFRGMRFCAQLGRIAPREYGRVSCCLKIESNYCRRPGLEPGPICGRPPWHKRFYGLIGSLASICPAC